MKFHRKSQTSADKRRMYPLIQLLPIQIARTIRRMGVKYFIKQFGDGRETEEEYRKMLYYPSFGRDVKEHHRDVSIIEPNDYFVFSFVSVGFLALARVKGSCVFNAETTDPNYDNEGYPHYVPVAPFLILPREFVLEVSEVRKWSNCSEQLQSYLNNAQRRGGIFRITEGDFDWFKNQLKKKMEQMLEANQ